MTRRPVVRRALAGLAGLAVAFLGVSSAAADCYKSTCYVPPKPSSACGGKPCESVKSTGGQGGSNQPKDLLLRQDAAVEMFQRCQAEQAKESDQCFAYFFRRIYKDQLATSMRSH